MDSSVETPVRFLSMLANPVRWKMLQALAKSDYTVRELAAIVGESDNLVSYHLGQLAKYNIVSERRGDADGRVAYYTLNVEHLRDAYFASGRAIHPLLGSVSGQADSTHAVEQTSDRPMRVLFLCTSNSARSQMAEAMLRDLTKGKVEVHSAGSQPSSVRSEAVWAMAQMGLDISSQRSKSLTLFVDQQFDYVITVCDRMKEVCPLFPGDVTRIHWSIADPAEIDGSEEVRRQAFVKASMELLTRIRLLLAVMERDKLARSRREGSPARQ